MVVVLVWGSKYAFHECMTVDKKKNEEAELRFGNYALASLEYSMIYILLT